MSYFDTLQAMSLIMLTPATLSMTVVLAFCHPEWFFRNEMDEKLYRKGDNQSAQFLYSSIQLGNTLSCIAVEHVGVFFIKQRIFNP
ncbi:hypothetical protein SDC9_96503 [bioreactor metagenome]|uniref:Uncharacterized protein n=1 Tax=bioreactor metagenome TaxID=1076179 RepID=A0A645A9G2_9ZZZZ